MQLRVVLLILLLPLCASAAADTTLTPEQIIERTMLSIVAIRADTPAGVSSGTGFVVDPSGIIVTNLHVIEGATRAAIKLHTGEQYTQIKVASFDEGRDLAVLRIPGFDLPPLSFGNSDDVKAGATVYAIGNPFGLEESVTKGIVSSVRVGDNGTKIIQTDSAVSPGNSGGPLIDEDGKVVGVVTFKIRGGENINFAVPINYARALLGFETLMSLQELARELGKEEVTLFVDSEPEQGQRLTGKWKSLTNINLTATLRQDGNFLYGSSSSAYDKTSYDLKLQPDKTYKGMARGEWTTFLNADNSPAEVCYYEREVEILEYSANRILGRTKAPRWPKRKRDQAKYRKSCGEDFPFEWIEHVWVRDN